MPYPDTQNLIEHRRLLKLAREYRQKGYEVTLYPSPNDLPDSLAGCSPDLVARSNTRTIIAEVRTKNNLTLNGPEDLRRISESVGQIPGWEFELVVTNPRKKHD